jgi:outer membrane immunogenic protein
MPGETFGPSPSGLSYNSTGPRTINPVGAPSSFDTRGFPGGIHGGYNWQYGNFLAGGELDFEYFRSAGSQTRTAPFLFAGNSISITSSVSTDWLFTARARLGYMHDDWLLYATGGLALTQLKASWSYFETLHNIAESASVSSTKTGWVVGGGIERGLTSGLTLGVEYLYVNFGDVSPPVSYPYSVFAPLDNPVHHSINLQSNLVRTRMTKRF